MKNAVMLTAVFILAFCIASFPQSKTAGNQTVNKNVQAYAVKLQQKILLNDDQTSKIKTILSEFVKGNVTSAENIKSTQTKVEAVLDKRQKAKYEIIKNEWWNGFISSLNKSSSK